MPKGSGPFDQISESLSTHKMKWCQFITALCWISMRCAAMNCNECACDGSQSQRLKIVVWCPSTATQCCRIPTSRHRDRTPPSECFSIYILIWIHKNAVEREKERKKNWDRSTIIKRRDLFSHQSQTNSFVGRGSRVFMLLNAVIYLWLFCCVCRKMSEWTIEQADDDETFACARLRLPARPSWP